MRPVKLWNFIVHDDGHVINARTGEECVVSRRGTIQSYFEGSLVRKNKARLIYDAFAPEGEKLISSDLIMFRDGNSSNCAFANLMRVPHSQYPVYDGLRIFSRADVEHILQLRTEGKSARTIAAMYGCHYRSIYKVFQGRYITTCEKDC